MRRDAVLVELGQVARLAVPDARLSTAPPRVRAAMRAGLVLVDEGRGGRGLEPRTVAEALALSRGELPTAEKVGRARRWYGRNARFGLAPKGTPAHVAWLLWGGAAGRDWWRGVAR